jgi:hypothetical protein
MKNPNRLLLATFSAFLTLFLFSCSKDVISDPNKSAQQVHEPSIQNTGRQLADAELYGGIQLYVNPPEAKVTILVHDNFFTSEEISPDENGFVLFENLPAGRYTVRIRSHNPKFENMTIRDVEVNAGKITELEQVNL